MGTTVDQQQGHHTGKTAGDQQHYLCVAMTLLGTRWLRYYTDLNGGVTFKIHTHISYLTDIL